jgi:hypothetical protein
MKASPVGEAFLFPCRLSVVGGRQGVRPRSGRERRDTQGWDHPKGSEGASLATPGNDPRWDKRCDLFVSVPRSALDRSRASQATRPPNVRTIRALGRSDR